MSDPSVMFFLQRLGGGEKCATQREVNWRCSCQSTVGTKLHEHSLAQVLLTDQACPAPSDKWPFSYPLDWSKPAMVSPGSEVVQNGRHND